MPVDLSSVCVLVPGDYLGRLVVCDLAMLVDKLGEVDTLHAAVDTAGIDEIEVGSEGAPVAIAKVRRLNETGDAKAYWGIV